MGYPVKICELQVSQITGILFPTQLVSMTNASVGYACSIEDATGYLPEVANALFEISQMVPIERATPCSPRKKQLYIWSRLDMT